MERERKIKILSMVAVIVAILGLTVAFASLSTTLTINGSASVDAASWDIHFANLSEASLQGKAVVVSDPEISQKGTELQKFNVEVSDAGDSVTYTFDVVNDGTIDASITSLIKNAKPICTSNVGIETDAQIVCNGLTYLLTYTDTNEVVKEGDILNKKTSRNLTLSLSYQSNQLPSDDVSISGLDITLQYSQN